MEGDLELGPKPVEEISIGASDVKVDFSQGSGSKGGLLLSHHDAHAGTEEPYASLKVLLTWPSRPSNGIHRGMYGLLLLGVVFWFCRSASTAVSSTSSQAAVGGLTTPPLGILPEIQQLWAFYSPWYPAGIYQTAPEGCSIVQANLRHGARYPSTSNAEGIQKAIKKLRKAKKYKDSKLDFLTNYTYDLGTNDLVPFGAAQSFDAGYSHYLRYESLISGDMLPFVRASGIERVIMSATNWSAGFASASGNVYMPAYPLILDEALNDTLKDDQCPDASSGKSQEKKWRSIYAKPIRNALNAAAPGAKLKRKDVEYLFDLCAFDTVANEAPSPFCALFNQSGFEGYEYSGDLERYYGTGYGNPLGPVQGVGYVNELLARLTGQPVQDETQTNHTLDSNPATFPLNRTMYADFSHDEEMTAVYAAIGLFPQAAPLAPIAPQANRTWVSSRLTPFSARMITENLSCAGEYYVRIFVNDALQPLEFCGGDENGLCSLDAFVESQAYARNNGDGDWAECFSS